MQKKREISIETIGYFQIIFMVNQISNFMFSYWNPTDEKENGEHRQIKILVANYYGHSKYKFFRFYYTRKMEIINKLKFNN